MFGSAGCGTQKNLQGDLATGLNVNYKLPKGTPLKYEQTSRHDQTFTVREQEMEMLILEYMAFSATASKPVDDNIPLQVIVDSMDMHITHFKGEIDPDLSTIIGQEFDMTLSSSGKEKNLENAREISYVITEGEESNLGARFTAIFPDLPKRAVKIGDSWISYDTLQEKNDSRDFTMTFETTNTFQGMETIEGYECMKISTTMTGKINSINETPEVKVVTEMDIIGEGTWYFAYQEGIFIKETSTATSTGELVAPEDSIPITRVVTYETKLIN